MKHKSHLLQLPSGRYQWVGSVLLSLCEVRENSIGQKFWGSKVFETKEEATKAMEEAEKIAQEANSKLFAELINPR